MPAIVIAPKRKVIINFEGKDYECRMPTLGEQIVFEEQVAEGKKHKAGGISKALRTFIMASGLPKDVVDKLDGDQLDAVTEALQPPKKK